MEPANRPRAITMDDESSQRLRHLHPSRGGDRQQGQRGSGGSGQPSAEYIQRAGVACEENRCTVDSRQQPSRPGVLGHCDGGGVHPGRWSQANRPISVEHRVDGEDIRAEGRQRSLIWRERDGATRICGATHPMNGPRRRRFSPDCSILLSIPNLMGGWLLRLVIGHAPRWSIACTISVQYCIS